MNSSVELAPKHSGLHEILEKSLKELSDIKFALDVSSIVAITDQTGKYNTPLNSDHWLRCKNVIKSPKTGGENEEAAAVSKRV